MKIILLSILAVAMIGLMVPSAFAELTITDDATGGDCSTVGTWDAGTKTCTLTGDVTSELSDGIIIGSDGITLQGDQTPGVGIPSIIGPTFGTTHGIKIDNKSNITIKDINLQNFEYGIKATNVNTLTLERIVNSGGQRAVDFKIEDSSNVTFDEINPNTDSEFDIISSNNIVMKNNIGNFGKEIRIVGSHDVEIKNNVNMRHIYLIRDSNQEIFNINIHDNEFRSVQGYGQAYDGMGLGTGIVIQDNTIYESVSLSGAFAAGPFTISGNTFTNSDHNKISIGTYGSSQYQDSHGVGGHSITDNTFTGGNVGVWLHGNNNSIIQGNTFHGQTRGVVLTGSQYNDIYENNFVLVNIPVELENTDNVMPKPQPPRQSTNNNLHHNYWSYFDSGDEDCYNDTPFDAVCDSSFSMTPTFYWPYSCQGACAVQRTVTIEFSDAWVEQDGAMPSSPIPSPPDTQAPSVSIPGSQTFQTTNPSGMTVNYGSVSASDDRGVTSGPTCTHASGTTFAVGSTTVTCTASDAAGNVGTASFTVTITVNFTPSITTSAFLNSTSSTGRTLTVNSENWPDELSAYVGSDWEVLYAITDPNDVYSITDIVNGRVMSTQTDHPGDWDYFGNNNFYVKQIYADDLPGPGHSTNRWSIEIPLSWEAGTYTITSSTAGSWNEDPVVVGPYSTTVTIPSIPDTTPPTVTPSITASAFLNSTSSTGMTLTANQGNWNDEVSVNAGTTGWQVLYTITDPNGASVADSLGQAGQSMNFWFSGFDQYGYQDRWSVEIPLSWEAGTYTITSSTVGSWNEDPMVVGPYSTTVTIPILDTAPPVVTVPSNTTLNEVTSNVGAVGTFSVSATDEVDGAVTTTCDTASGATFPVGITTVTCTASDAAGNVGTASFTVTVVEYAAPVLVNARFVDAFGNSISDIVTGQQVQIEADMVAMTGLDFAYLIEVSGPVYEQMWLPGHLGAGQSYSPALSWIAPAPGDYSFMIKIVDNMSDKNLLTEQLELQLNIPSPPEETTIQNAQGSSSPGCEPNCFIPNPVSISVGGQVTFVNNDSVVHTATYGDVGAANTGSVWNSNLIMPGSSFSIALNSSGVYPYYCMVHPWMTGTIYVGTGIPEPEPQPDAELSLSLNKSEFDLDELITVGASISEISGTSNVTIEVSDPNGNPVITRMLTVGNSAAQLDFRISDMFVVGYYKISASSNVNGNVITDHVFFNIKSQYDQFQIESVQVTDQQGNPSTLQSGGMAHIKVTLTSNINIEPLVTVNLFDSSLTTLGVGSVSTPINKGESEIILSFLIPEDAALGGAMIYVNAFTDWVSNGGVSLTGEVSKLENISS